MKIKILIITITFMYFLIIPIGCNKLNDNNLLTDGSIKTSIDTTNKNAVEKSEEVNNKVTFEFKKSKYTDLIKVPCENIDSKYELFVYSNIGSDNTGEIVVPNAFSILDDKIFILDTLGKRIIAVNDNKIINEISFDNYIFNDMIDFYVENDDSIYILNEPLSRGVFHYYRGEVKKVEDLSKEIQEYNSVSAKFINQFLYVNSKIYYDVINNKKSKINFKIGSNDNKKFYLEYNNNIIELPDYANYEIVGEDVNGEYIYLQAYKNLLSIDDPHKYVFLFNTLNKKIYISEIKFNNLSHRDIYVDNNGTLYQQYFDNSNMVISKIEVF